MNTLNRKIERPVAPIRSISNQIDCSNLLEDSVLIKWFLHIVTVLLIVLILPAPVIVTDFLGWRF
jgi:hypothetical protein